MEGHQSNKYFLAACSDDFGIRRAVKIFKTLVLDYMNKQHGTKYEKLIVTE